MRTLVELTTDEKTSTSRILSELRISATRIELKEVEEWTRKESVGYEDHDDVPEHRKIGLQIIGNVQSGFYYTPGIDLTTSIPENLKEYLTHECRIGMRTIERIVEQKDRSAMLGVGRPGLVAAINKTYMNAERECLQARAVFPDTALREIIAKAREKALTICLDCEKVGLTFLATEEEGKEPERQKSYLKALGETAVKVGAKELCRKILTGV